jgi:tetratricopeptide (TPR) repeat protein
MDLTDTLQQAITFHKAGELEVAERLYRSILTEEPKHPDANHNLGVLLKQGDKADIALPFFKTALEANPNQGQYWVSYIDTLIHLGQYDAAQNILSQGQAKGLKGDAVDQLKESLKSQHETVTIIQAQVDTLVALYSQGQIQKALTTSDAIIQNYPTEPALYNISGACYKILGQLDTAVKRYEQALAIKPDYAEAYNNLGITLKELGQLDAAVKRYEQALAIKPDYAEAHSNLGNMLQEFGQLDAAVKCYEQALTIKPDYAEAYNNLGIALKELGQLDAAVKCYEQALAIKPDYAEAHSNLGNMLQEFGQLDAAVRHFEHALSIKPDFSEVWNNVFLTAKTLDRSSTQNTWLESYKEKLDEDILNNVHFKILEYRLKACTPHSVDNYFDNATNALPLKTIEEIANPLRAQENQLPVLLSKNLIALFHFGRSGTGLLHSLIDNHPEISTLPSIYFSEYYNEEVWGKLISLGWDQLPENFTRHFAVLFDARSSMPIPGIDKPIANLGQKEGLANVGANRDEVLTVDQNRFCAELRKLMADYASLTPQVFFVLVHNAYEKVLNNKANKQSIFYHIHNPSPYAKLNFLRYNYGAILLMMVREPVQSCESWIKKEIKTSSENTHNRIVTMLFDIDQIAFRRHDSVGVRLEDLKTHPKETMRALCNWMGVQESPTLYEMTAQGKKWWGDPTSIDYTAKGMSPFDDSSITRKIGSVFSEQDQFILRTLFYPFSVRFGYVEENLIGFKEDLKAIKPLLDEPFGFQKQLAENLSQDLEAITRSGSALYFRSALHDRWRVLNEFNDYPHMLKPLLISVES